MQVLLVGVRRLFVGWNNVKRPQPAIFYEDKCGCGRVCESISLLIPPFGRCVSCWVSFSFNKP